MAMPYGELVERLGLSEVHRLIIHAVPPRSRVLDVGCATGYVAAELAKRGCSVIGFDADAESAKLAERHCERVIVGDLESAEVRAGLPRGMDVVILGEVLEHLSDPLTVLRETHGLLADGGRVIVSIPNVAAWSARKEIALGRFPYADSGIFDRTHLRFFTRRTLHDLVRDAGFEIADERATAGALPLEAPLYRAFTRAVQPAAPSAQDDGSAAPDSDRAASDEPLTGPVAGAARRALGWIRRSALRARPELFASQFVLDLRPVRPAAPERSRASA